MTKYHMTYQDAYDLYGKYIGNWGAHVPTFRFEAVKDGKVVRPWTQPRPPVHLEGRWRTTPTLQEGATYDDVAALRITARTRTASLCPSSTTP